MEDASRNPNTGLTQWVSNQLDSDLRSIRERVETRVENKCFLDLLGEVGEQHLAEIVGWIILVVDDVASSCRERLRLPGLFR